jgi:hypothetical protein
MRVERWDSLLPKGSKELLVTLLSRVQLASVSESETKSLIARAVEGSDYKTLCTVELKPSCLSCEDFFHLSQVLAFFRKRDDIAWEGVDPRGAAWDTFCKAEALCKETNEIFRRYSRGGFYFRPRVESILFIAQRKISTILGDLPSLSTLKLRFGPGATTQVKKKDASARRKLSKAFCCSEDMLSRLSDVLREVPSWSQVDPEGNEDCYVEVEDSRIDFVRKTAKTDRTIAVEPMLNSMVQLAIGDFVADRLRRFGVDLKDQSHNQRLAREGSITGALATLDLSSASDTVSCGLVESLLPFDWWDFLRSFRSSHALSPLDGSRIRLEKFSTMGNGFTFALESLIFFALTSAAEEVTRGAGEPPGTVSVYGDDIIVPTRAFDLLVECLTACGFTANLKKSFSTGPFRESCGKDYFSGTLVRPVFIKRALDGELLFTLHNFFVREMDYTSASTILGFISEEMAIYGPDGYGDGHLLEWDTYSVSRLGRRPYTLPSGRDRGWSGYTFETYTRRPRQAFYRLNGDYVYPQYSVYLSGDGTDSFGAGTPAGAKRIGHFLRRLRRPDRVPHGTLRPERLQSTYQGGSLQDSLPGSQGYKRIKIYTFEADPLGRVSNRSISPQG